MLRHYLTPIITWVAPDGVLARVPKVAGGGVSYSALFSIEQGRQIICMVAVDAEDHSAFLADPDNDAFPDIDPDVPLSTILSARQFDVLKKRLAARGINTLNLSISSTLIQALVICADYFQPGIRSDHIKFKV